MDPKSQILKSLKKVTGVKDIHLDIPEREEFGDYSTNVAMQLVAKNNLKGQSLSQGQSLKKNPRDLASYLKSQLDKDAKLAKFVTKIQVAGGGFINFHLKTDVLLNNLIQIEAIHPRGESNPHLGGGKQVNFLKGQKLVLEFAHPNTHKPFHIGHLRNIVTGEALSRMLEFSGAKVTRVNYQGDVGLHIAKALWGIKKLGFSDLKDIKTRAEFLGKAYVEGNTAYEKNETAKEEIHKINEALYKGEDKELIKLYKETRQWSLEYFESIYKRVGTKFDRLYFESEVAEEGVKLAGEALEKNILEKSEGAVIFPGVKYGLHDRVFITSRCVPTYEGKDLGLAKLQFEENDPDLLIHIVGPEQSEYFKVVFKALEMVVPETKGKEVHVPYGWVRLKEGKMSSRTGNVVLGEWLLDEAKRKIIEKYDSDPNVAEQIAVGAVKYSFLKNSLNQEIAFDLNESISLEGNSGPYLQYTYARTQSVLRKSEARNTKHETNHNVTKSKRQNVSNLDHSNLEFVSNLEIRTSNLNEEELSLLRHFFHFPDIIAMSVKLYSPNLICNYLYDLAQKFNTFYNKHKILVDNPLELELRLRLASATSLILKSGLNLLGIETPPRM